MSERLVLKGFEPFVAKHCESGALKTVLDYHGLSLSEEMLLGLGGGIGFIYWYMKMMPSPFIGARYGKGTNFTTNICRRIGAEVSYIETSSPKRGYEELKALLRAGEPAVVYGDIVYLPYLALPEVAHFGAHAFVVTGLDEDSDEVYICDRGRNPVTISLAELARARSSKFPPLPPRHRLLRISFPEKVRNLKEGIKESLGECCRNMLEPPIKNVGLTGMQKWSEVVVKWPDQFRGMSLLSALMNGFSYIEIAGTGGSAFRPMYARFLEKASSIIDEPELKEVARMMWESAGVWSEIASRLLPDSWPNLKRMRQLILEKNRLFEEQEPGALEAMRRISGELEELMTRATAELSERPTFLSEAQQSILRCYEIEYRAFQKLGQLITR